MSKRESYVGVSGVVSPDQAEELYESTEALRRHRRLALGVKVVHKTQWSDVENKYGTDWYPVGEAVAGVLPRETGPGAFHVAQMFLDIQEAANQRIGEYERRFVRRAMGRTANWLDAVQFDLLPWDIMDYRRLFGEMKNRQPELEILLQCQGPIMTAYGPRGALQELDIYRGYVDHVLFDASHGTGAEMDPEALRPFIEEASARDWLAVGVAGGLNAERVKRHLPALLEVNNQLSFDAEGQLHKNSDGNKGLNMKVTRNYLDEAERVVVGA